MTKFSTSPYPGLGAFRPDESDIFFGREEQTDRLLERLQRSHFLAVVGASGCGKSSLVRAGMIAALETGFMADAGSRWRIAEMRPGDRPMSRLARALSTSQALGSERAHALSDHADEVLNELTDPQRKIAEIMFRRLTERGVGKRDTRAPARLSDVAAVAGVSAADVAAVAEAFRRPDRCFVTPPVEMALGPDTLLDIGHESLIRQWRLLGEWVEQEGRSALMYRRLTQTGQLWKAGDAAPWRNPDLERALRWEQTQRPSLAWAIRYSTAGEFELAMEFLRASERVWSEEQRQAKRQRSLWHRILGTAAIVLLIAAVVIAGFAVSFKRQYDATTYYKQFTVLRPLYAAWTPGSADRNILFACQLALVSRWTPALHRRD